MSIFGKIFGQAPQPAATPPVNGAVTPGVPNPNSPQNLGTHSSDVTAPNGVVPKQEPTEEPSPLGNFKDLWQNDPKAPAPPTGKVFDGIDPNKLREAAKSKDFSQVISPESLAKIQAGGAEATAEMLKVMSTMTQASFGESTVATTQLIDAALVKQREQFLEALPGIIRKASVSESLREENPAYNNPAAQPVIQALESQFALKHPNATQAQIKDHVKTYLNEFSTLFAKPDPVAAAAAIKAKKSVGTDWEAWGNEALKQSIGE